MFYLIPICLWARQHAPPNLPDIESAEETEEEDEEKKRRRREINNNGEFACLCCLDSGEYIFVC